MQQYVDTYGKLAGVTNGDIIMVPCSFRCSFSTVKAQSISFHHFSISQEALGIAEGRGGRRGPENVWGSTALRWHELGKYWKIGKYMKIHIFAQSSIANSEDSKPAVFKLANGWLHNLCNNKLNMFEWIGSRVAISLACNPSRM